MINTLGRKVQTSSTSSTSKLEIWKLLDPGQKIVLGFKDVLLKQCHHIQRSGNGSAANHDRDPSQAGQIGNSEPPTFQ